MGMRREIHEWWSPNLNEDMGMVVYGNYGFPLLLFPTAAADFLEYERFLMIDALAPIIESGKVKVYSINSINNESWLNENMHTKDKAMRHQQYNEYVLQEVVPFIYSDCGGKLPIYTTGASLGAFHAANTFFRRPDIFGGTIAMSGGYSLKDYTNGYFDDNCYFNSPVDYLPNWDDEYILNCMRQGKIIIASGQGDYEKPSASIELSELLNNKGIPNVLDLWGYDISHDWPTWREMLPYFLNTHF